jgi:hypothetical protein
MWALFRIPVSTALKLFANRNPQCLTSAKFLNIISFMIQGLQRKKAPYAPASGVLTAIRRYRERGLPEPVETSVLESIGVSPGNAPVTLSALKFLNLLDTDGKHTERFDALKRATSEDYPSVLLSVLQDTYGDVFVIVDPQNHSRSQVEDAFRQFEPAAQRERMVALFVGLCKEAGLTVSGSSAAQKERKSEGERRPRNHTSKPERKNSDPKTVPVQIALEQPKTETRVNYELIAALLRQLPSGGAWTSTQRDKWLKAMTANVDVLIEVSDAGAD